MILNNQCACARQWVQTVSASTLLRAVDMSMISVSLLAFGLKQAGLQPQDKSYMDIAKNLQGHGVETPEDLAGMKIETIAQGMSEHDKQSLEEHLLMNKWYTEPQNRSLLYGRR